MTMSVESFAEVEEYITLLTGDPDAVMSWRMLGEPDRSKPARNRDGTLTEVEEWLAHGVADGYAVYACVNEMDGTGRRKGNVSRIRAVYAEFDGGAYTAPPIEPTFVVQSKNGKHLYWVLTDTITVAQAEDLMARIIAVLGSDPTVKDATRVLRIPGFPHRKNPDEPFDVTISAQEVHPKWTYEQLCDAFPQIAAPERTRKSPKLDAVSAVVTDTNYGLAAAAKEFEKIAAVERGTGRANQTVYQAAFNLATLFHSDLTEKTALEYIWRACERIQYTPDGVNGHDAMNTIQSGFRAGRENTRADRVAQLSNEVKRAATYPIIPSDYLLKSRIGSVVDEMRRRRKLGYRPAPSPVRGLNELLGGGAQMGGTTLVGAPPGYGKSSLCLEWARQGAVTYGPSIYVTLEMTYLECVTRFGTQKEGRWGDYYNGYHVEVIEGMRHQMRDSPFYLMTYEDIHCIDDVRMFVDAVAQEHGVAPLLVIDYIQMLCPATVEDNQMQQMSVVSQGVRNIGREFHSPIVCVTSVNRGSYNMFDQRTRRPNRGMVLASAKMTGQLEYDAKAVCGVCIYDDDNSNGHKFGWISVAKNRLGGSTGDVPVEFDGRRGQFNEVSEDDIYRWLDELREQNHGIEVRTRLIEALEDAGSFPNTGEWCAAAKVQKKKGCEEIKSLVTGGFALRDSDGYSIAKMLTESPD